MRSQDRVWQRPGREQSHRPGASGGDTLSAAAITRLKQDIAGALGDDQADLEALRTTASNLVSAGVISGLSEGSQADGGQSHRYIVKTHVQNLRDDIQDNRR